MAKRQSDGTWVDRNPIGTCYSCGGIAYKRIYYNILPDGTWEHAKGVEGTHKIEDGEWVYISADTKTRKHRKFCAGSYSRVLRTGTTKRPKKRRGRVLTNRQAAWVRTQSRKGLPATEIHRQLEAKGESVSVITVRRIIRGESSYTD